MYYDCLLYNNCGGLDQMPLASYWEFMAIINWLGCKYIIILIWLIVLNNDLTKKCIKMFHKNWVSQEGFYTNWTIIWICKATRIFPYKHAQYNYCEYIFYNRWLLLKDLIGWWQGIYASQQVFTSSISYLVEWWWCQFVS